MAKGESFISIYSYVLLTRNDRSGRTGGPNIHDEQSSHDFTMPGRKNVQNLYITLFKRIGEIFQEIQELLLPCRGPIFLFGANIRRYMYHNVAGLTTVSTYLTYSQEDISFSSPAIPSIPLVQSSI